MTKPLDVLLVSRKREALAALTHLLRGEAITVREQLNTNGHVDPLHGVEDLPELVILHASQLWREELEAFIARPRERRPALIVISQTLEMSVMRLAMQAGAHDVLPAPPSKSDLAEALKRVAQERKAPATKVVSRMSAFINAKGGCGATLIACNVAHMLSVVAKKRTMLVDFDLQFGTAPLYFDLYPKRGIAQVIENLESLDELALDGYCVRHESGLGVLSHAVDDPVGASNLLPTAAERLLQVAARNHDHVIVDLPRHASAAAASVLQRANQVVVVLQQSVSALRDAARLLQWLRNDLGMSGAQIVVVVNRHDKQAPITKDDVQASLSCEAPVLIPNDFGSASECVNTGTPLLTYAKNAAITRALLGLQAQLSGSAAPSSGGLLMRTWSSLTGGSTR